VCGYAGVADPHRGNPAPAAAGITRLDLHTGERKLILSLADVVKHGAGRDLWDASAQHFFQHVLFSPDGSRFIFLHRWQGKKEGKGFATRMFTASADGGDLHVMTATGKASHFCWRDPGHVLAWALHPSLGAKFYVFKDRSDEPPVPVAPDVLTEDGHCTYLPDPGGKDAGRWILSDTYPDRARNQHPYLFDVKSGVRHPLGHFASPPMYTGDIRCDTHPRSSPDGKQVMIDSPHGGEGRQMYLIDVTEISARQ
jgi:hypothetical protein